MDKESHYLLQLIDCNCNDCLFMSRNLEKTKAHVDSYDGTGLMDRMAYGHCNKFDKQVTFIPVTCQVETQDCFEHRLSKLTEAERQERFKR